MTKLYYDDKILISKSVIGFRYHHITGGIKIQDKVLRKLFLGFISIHILYHAKKEPFYGSWMIEELKSHGYDISSGTLYPILHSMSKDGLLVIKEKNTFGKIRKYYSITEEGEVVLVKAKEKAKELFLEVGENKA